MNYGMIRYLLGWVLNFEAIFLILPIVVDLIYGESTWSAFLITAVICLALGVLMIFRKPKRKALYAREGHVIVAFSWILISLLGAIPFVISGAIPSYIDALFESVSGFTTTGATILNSVEDLPHSCLFWRSFTHWIGGMGVLIFIMAFLPLFGANNMNLMRAESPGPSVGKLVPHIRTTAIWLYGMYLALTVLEFIALLEARMPLFDAINTAISTAGTGGFGIKNDSMAGYSTSIQVIVTIFMILFGINFNFYFFLLTRKISDAFKISEVWIYLGIVLCSSTMITINIRNMYGSIGEAYKNAIFTSATIMSSTGFATTDFNLWPTFSKTLIVIMLFIGACAGSTGGGFKVSRIMILVKTALKEMHIQIHPKQIKKIKIDGKEIPHEVVRSTNTYMVVYILLFVISILLLCFDNCDLVTNFTTVLTCMNNMGPGLELTGPAANFSFFSPCVKGLLIMDMLAGRLELFPVLLLFVPATWKRQ